jgi:hypothetical protein
MPFSYFGGKKALAKHYPPPAEHTIIEPFAGSAGYALHWATPQHRVILIEKDPAVYALWRRLQSPDAVEDLMSVDCPAEGEKIVDPLLMLTQGGTGGLNGLKNAVDPIIAMTSGKDLGGRAVPFAPLVASGAAQMQSGLAGRVFTVTSRMALQWPTQRARLITALPIIRPWTVLNIGYEDIDDELGNLRATWFVDPPYWVPPDEQGTRGDGYRHGASGIDFDHLGAWCRARRGQVIVCEQEGAAWLPFRPLRRATTASGTGSSRVEVVWSRTPGRALGTTSAADATAAARARRNARRTTALR